MTSTRSPADANIARWPRSRLGRLAVWCYDHRRRVLLGWLLAVVAVIGLAQWAGSRLVDATVVRMVLVPAVMQLPRSANWWLPGRIGRAIPNLAIEPNLDQTAHGGLARTRPVGA